MELKLKSYKIEKFNYYKLEDIVETYNKFDKGCKNASDVVQKYELDVEENDYIYARLKKDEWKKSNGSSKKFDKIFIRRKWFDDNFDENELELLIDNTELAPPIINLNASEKFLSKITN